MTHKFLLVFLFMSYDLLVPTVFTVLAALGLGADDSVNDMHRAP